MPLAIVVERDAVRLAAGLFEATMEPSSASSSSTASRSGESGASVIEMLWRLSFADERLDKHEEQLIRRVAGLLHVPDRELLRLRAQVRAEVGSQ